MKIHNISDHTLSFIVQQFRREPIVIQPDETWGDIPVKFRFFFKGRNESLELVPVTEEEKKILWKSSDFLYNVAGRGSDGPSPEEALYLKLSKQLIELIAGETAKNTVSTNATTITLSGGTDKITGTLEGKTITVKADSEIDEETTTSFTVTGEKGSDSLSESFDVSVTPANKPYINFDDTLTIKSGDTYEGEVDTNGTLSAEYDSDRISVSFSENRITIETTYGDEETVELTLIATLDGETAEHKVTITLEAEPEIYLIIDPDHSTENAGTSPITIPYDTNATEVEITCDSEKVIWEKVDSGIQITSSEYSETDYTVVFTISCKLGDQETEGTYTLTFSAWIDLYVTLDQEELDIEVGESGSVGYDTNGQVYEVKSDNDEIEASANESDKTIEVTHIGETTIDDASVTLSVIQPNKAENEKSAVLKVKVFTVEPNVSLDPDSLTVTSSLQPETSKVTANGDVHLET